MSHNRDSVTWWTERYRGQPGFLGWVVLRWDVLVVRAYTWYVRRLR